MSFNKSVGRLRVYPYVATSVTTKGSNMNIQCVWIFRLYQVKQAQQQKNSLNVILI